MKPRVLFVGDDFVGSNSTSLRKAFAAIGCHVAHVNTHPFKNPYGKPLRRVFKRLRPNEYEEWMAARLAVEIRRAVNEQQFDVLIGFKTLWLSPELLTELPFPKIHYHPDDASNPVNRSGNYERAESYWDLHLTTKSFNVDEIKRRSGRDAVFLWCAYDRDWHRPVRKDGAPRFKLGFVGTMRPDRRSLITRLANKYGDEMLIAGRGWRKALGAGSSAVVVDPQFGPNFSLSVSDAPLQLGLLNSDNRDLHTCRSFEVPAAGGMLLAERTSEHEELFEDWRTAVMFDSDEQLEERLEILVRDASLVDRIREDGGKAIVGGGNSYEDRARQIVDIIGGLGRGA